MERHDLAGDAADGRGRLANAIAESWNGTSWTRMTPIMPTGTRVMERQHVDGASGTAEDLVHQGYVSCVR
jgi:hypothetical protein